MTERMTPRKKLSKQLLTQEGIFESNIHNPDGWSKTVNISDRLLEKALEAIGDRISLSPKMLAKKMGLDQNSANNTLCGHILSKLKWKKWNPNNGSGAWIKGDVEFD